MSSIARVDQRASLVQAAIASLNSGGPESIQARTLTASVGTSTQAVYTLFGGMPGLFEAVVAEGFSRMSAHITAVPETDDPVADFVARGQAYCIWAFANPKLYGLMFGLAAVPTRLRAELDIRVGGPFANFPEGQAAVEVLVGSLRRVTESGRIRAVDPVTVARQFLSATHGFVLLQIAGAFGEQDGPAVIIELTKNLLLGLGDEPDAIERSFATVFGAG